MLLSLSLELCSCCKIDITKNRTDTNIHGLKLAFGHAFEIYMACILVVKRNEIAI